MRLPHALFLASLAFFASPADARQGGGGGGDAAREACREEARQSIKPGRTSRVDREQIREMRREYTRNCRKKSRSS